MRSPLRRTLFGAVTTTCVASILAADSRCEDNLSAYRTTKTARTREITPARPGHAGQTGFLGVSVVRGRTGELVVEHVQSESPAAKAGIQNGDVLTHLDGVLVASPERLCAMTCKLAGQRRP